MSQAAKLVDQVEFWNGDAGRRWAENQERLDRAFAPLTTPLLQRAAVQPGYSVLEVGCGAGAVSLALARQAGASGRVLALDLSRPMLERARARDEAESGRDRAPIEWRDADAGTFPFAPASVDVIVSRFGVMFFSDPVAAFGNLRRALRPGGRLVMMSWRALAENAWVAVPRAALLTILPPPPPMPQDAPGPFAFADAARVGAILARAGFAEIRSAAADSAIGVSADIEEQTQFLTQLSPASALLREADETARPGAIDAVRAALRERAEWRGPELGTACWLFAAQNPS